MTKSIRRALVALAMAPLLSGAWGSAAAAPRVVASILPVHSLVAAVMEGVGAPDLLIPAAVSPHAYALRPADARALSGADAVFWIGSALETFLQKPLDSLAGDARVVALLDAPDLRRLETRPAAAWTGPPDGARHDEADHDHAGGINPHVWLDPRNAAAMVRWIAATLSDIDAANAQRYEANAAAALARLEALDRELATRLAPVAGRPYVVFHDAYQYLEARYGLTPVGAVTLQPDRPAGARHVRTLRAAIAESGAACAFREPQMAPPLLAAVVEGTTARVAVLDPLGTDLEPGPDAYFTLMRTLAETLAACLSP